MFRVNQGTADGEWPSNGHWESQVTDTPHHTPDGPANSKKCRELFSLLFTADNPTFPEYPYLAFNG